ncbi:hypothetical protein BDN71DRAFT_423469 [Pleurotus eryngii]|uniref:Uncharacterized protein n=1 Tax=Pleurotus eryngii TaxID=5323 RepID=A0A9P6DBA2_PLEER|nr:hypothetical protein BDN71DRAFT_423469 [Pleurotus eryngii]
MMSRNRDLRGPSSFDIRWGNSVAGRPRLGSTKSVSSSASSSEKSQKCLPRLFGYFCGLRAPLKPFRSHVPGLLLLSGTFLSPKGPKRPQKARRKAKVCVILLMFVEPMVS